MFEESMSLSNNQATPQVRMQGLANLLIDNEMFDKAFDRGVKQTTTNSSNGDLNNSLDFNQLMISSINNTGSTT